MILVIVVMIIRKRENPEKEKSVTGYGGSTSLECETVNCGRLEWKWMIVFVYGMGD